MKRKVNTWTVTTRRTPDEAFAYLADFNRHAEWSPKPYRVEGYTAPTVKGATFTSYGWIPGDGDHKNEVEVTEVESPSRLAFSALEDGQRFENLFVVEADGAGSKISRTVDMPVPKGFVGVIFPLLFATVIKSGIQKGMNNLGAKLDSGA